MWVRCRLERPEQVSDSTLEHQIAKYVSTNQRGRLPVEKEELYVVYGILFEEDPWPNYLICGDNYTGYPRRFPSRLFTIEDSRMSRHWRFREFESSSEDDGSSVEKTWYGAVIEPWNDCSSYAQVISKEDHEGGEPWEERKIWYDYREKLYYEFAPPGVDTPAVRLAEDRDWVQCPECAEAWRIDRHGEMLQCSECEKLLLNPM